MTPVLCSSLHASLRRVAVPQLRQRNSSSFRERYRCCVRHYNELASATPPHIGTTITISQAVKEWRSHLSCYELVQTCMDREPWKNPAHKMSGTCFSILPRWAKYENSQNRQQQLLDCTQHGKQPKGKMEKRQQAFHASPNAARCIPL